MTYNKVSAKLLLLLLNFLFAYENSIKSFSSNNEFNEKFGKCQCLYEICSFVKVCSPKNVLMVKNSKNAVNMTKSKNTVALSFMNHLRNAFAHGKIRAKGSYFYFEDSKGDCTASGCIKTILLTNFLVTFEK